MKGLILLFVGFLSFGTFEKGFSQNPFISSTFPTEGAVSLSCYTNISATVRFTNEGTSIDPATLDGQSVRLYPKDKPRKSVPIQLEFNKQLKYIILTVDERLEPQTKYIFEVNSRLSDDRGFAFQPFKLSFTTGDCGQDIVTEPEAPRVSTPEINFQLTKLFAKREGDSVAVGWKAEEHMMVESYWIEKAQRDTIFMLLDTKKHQKNKNEINFFIFFIFSIIPT